MNVELPYADGTLTATLPAGTRRLSSEPAGALPPLAIHGAGATIGVVEQPAMPADPERAGR